MKIGILGGSFDPPHNGHVLIAKTLLKRRFCEKVIFMPTGVHPFAKKLSKPRHRLSMAKLLEEPNIEVSDMEIKRKETSFTIDTLKTLKKHSPNDDFVWIIGTDQLANFTKWKNWKEIIEKFGLIVIPRQGSVRLRGGAEGVKDFKPIPISSSEIRKKVKEGKDISKLVPKSAESYIIQHRLYL